MKGGSFAQVSKAALSQLTDTLAVVLKASAFSSDDKNKLQALVQEAEGTDDDFLSRSAPDAKAYESHSGSILDTLEDMKEKAVAMRNEAQKGEMKSKHAFEMLAQSLKNELAIDGKALDEAKAAKAVASETKATAEADLSMTEKSLAEAEDYLKGRWLRSSIAESISEVHLEITASSFSNRAQGASRIDARVRDTVARADELHP